MFSKTLILLSSLAATSTAQSVAQGFAPAPSRLTATQSGVLPIAPTPFPGVDTIQGAITYDGNPMPGFTGPGGNASVQSNTPGTSYSATLPTTPFNPFTGSTIQGTITGAAAANGSGVMFTVNFSMLPSEAMYGPFAYHIHNLPIGPDGNCTAAMGHLDPTNRGELYACDVANPQSCQAGDLSGKHGNITTTSFSASYVDLYLSTTPGSPYFFGDKSIVIHASNTTRLTCANFSMVAAGSSSSSTTTRVVTSSSSAAAAAGGGGAVGGIPLAQATDGQIGGTVAAGPRVTTTSTLTAAVAATTSRAVVSQISDGQIQASSAATRASSVAPAQYTGAGVAVRGEGMMGLVGGVVGAMLLI